MTKNTWLVGIGHSMQDAADTLIPEMFLEKSGRLRGMGMVWKPRCGRLITPQTER